MSQKKETLKFFQISWISPKWNFQELINGLLKPKRVKYLVEYPPIRCQITVKYFS